uniref:Uncharacterized protein n=1 Tax=Vespula pensylvanica TaxID=30213 RepID=A0A834NZJ1_VESPE|nr:hypothetical protein H0235_009933 [Vespula pensylvanica]
MLNRPRTSRICWVGSGTIVEEERWGLPVDRYKRHPRETTTVSSSRNFPGLLDLKMLLLPNCFKDEISITFFDRCLIMTMNNERHNGASKNRSEYSSVSERSRTSSSRKPSEGFSAPGKSIPDVRTSPRLGDLQVGRLEGRVADMEYRERSAGDSSSRGYWFLLSFLLKRVLGSPPIHVRSPFPSSKCLEPSLVP